MYQAIKLFRGNGAGPEAKTCYDPGRTLGSSRLPSQLGRTCINMIGPQAMVQVVGQLDETIEPRAAAWAGVAPGSLVNRPARVPVDQNGSIPRLWRHRRPR